MKKLYQIRPYFYATLILLVILSFVLSAGEVRHRAREMDLAAFNIADNASPTIMYLSALHGEVRRLHVQVERHLDQADAGVFASTAEFRATFAHIQELALRYQSLPMFPGESALWARGNRALLHLNEVVERLIALLEQRHVTAAKELAHGEFFDAVNQAVESIIIIVEFNAQQTHLLAERVRELRAILTRSSVAISCLGTLLTLIAVLLIGTSARRWAQSRDTQRRMAVERAEALESFAGQVAHDILNPLSTVSYALAGIEPGKPEEKLRALVARGTAGVERARLILDGLLKFACAGAQPEPGARADVHAVMAELGPELAAQAAELSIDLQVELCSACTVACGPGILSSIMTNLAQNAIKYMGDPDERPERRIAIRAFDRGGRVRFEVEDTGPGLPPGFEKAIFEPCVRGPGSRQPGFGLGLATVKKAVQAHGGSVGVSSVIGRGCLFFFELPKSKPAA